MRLKLILGTFLSLLPGICHATCDATLLPSHTTRAGITVPQINSCGWGTVTNGDWSIVDSSAAFQGLANSFTSTQTFTQPIIVQPTQPLRFYDASTHYLSFQASPTVTTTNFIFPASDGSSGQFLRTDGTGNLSFGSAGGGTPTLAVQQSGVTVSSPTTAINFTGPPFSISLTGGNVAQVDLNTSSVTLQGNTFNQASSLLQLDASTRLPAVDGSQLLNLPSVSGVQIYPATGTPSFPFGFTASSATFSSNIDVTGNTSVRAGNRLKMYGSGDVAVSTITNPSAALSQLRIDAASGVGINLVPISGYDLAVSTISASSSTITTINVNSIKYADGTIQVSSPSSSGSSFTTLSVSTITLPSTANISPIFRGSTKFLTFGGTNSTFIGENAGVRTSTNTGITAVGAQALGQISLATNESTAFGYNASSGVVQDLGSTSVGYEALAGVTTSQWNTAVGVHALQGNYPPNTFPLGSLVIKGGDYNTVVGAESLLSNTTGYKNTVMGAFTFQDNTSGHENVVIGGGALSGVTAAFDTIVGRSAGNNTCGDLNTFIGYGSRGPISSPCVFNSIAFGANAVVSASNVAQIGATSGDSAVRVNMSTMTVSSGTVTSFIEGINNYGSYGSSGTITPDARSGNNITVTLTSTVTINVPTNASDFQMFRYRIIQDGTGSRTITLGTGFQFGVDITTWTASTAANKEDYLGCIYRTSNSKCDVVSGSLRGY